MNIISRDLEPLPKMHPLITPPLNPYIVLDFQSRDHEWCTTYFPTIKTIDPNTYKRSSLPNLYAILDQLELHFDNMQRPTIIPTNSFPTYYSLSKTFSNFFAAMVFVHIKKPQQFIDQLNYNWKVARSAFKK